MKKAFSYFFFGLLILAGLYVSSLYNYLLFHNLAEIFSIVIAFGIFAIAWNSRPFLDNNYLLFIGIAFLFVGGLDLVHTFSYKGMAIFAGFGSNLPTQLWIAARYMESFSLLIAPLFFHRRLKTNLVFLGYSAAVALILLSIFFWKVFPVCFVEGVGLTLFKKTSEYIICLILLGSIGLLLKNRKEFDRKVLQRVIWSIIVTIASELAFTFYVDVYGLSNLIGHYLKILSFYLMYKAIIETGLTKPYDLLFRNVKQSEERYRIVADNTYDWEFWLNPEGKFHYVSPSCKRITGRDTEEFIRDPSLRRKIVYSEDMPVFDRHLEEGEKREGGVREIEFRIVRPDGTLRWIGHVCKRIFDEEGRFLGIRGSNRDITPRKNAEEALRESEERWATTLASIGDAVISTDVQGRITFMNAVAEALTGWKLAEASTRLATEVLTVINEQTHRPVDNPITQVLLEGKIIGLANRTILLRKDGTEVPIDDSGAPIRDRNGKTVGVVLVFRDITERKQADEALRKSEARYRSYIEVTEQLGWTTNADGEVVEDIPSWRKFTGQSEEETKGWGWSNALHPDDLEPTARVWRDAVARKSNYEVEYRIRRYDGVYRDFLARGVPVLKDNGDVLEWVGTCIDITERRRVREELRKSRDELEIKVQERTAELGKQSRILEGFFKSTITPLVFLDRNFNFIRVNEAYAKCCQREISKFEGHNHFEFYPHEENEAIFRRVVETKVPYQVVAKPFSFPDHPEWGTSYWDWTLTPLLDGKGEVEFLVFSLEDVTKRKRAEVALQETSLYARSLIEASIDPLVTISRDGKIMDVNRATELATGLSRDALIGSDFSNYFTEPERAREGYEQVFSKGTVRDYPLAIRHTSGRVIEVLYNATIYKNEAGEVQGVFAAARDITERKQAEEALRKAHDQVRFFASQCLTTQETERRRIAGELHDSIAGSLAAIKLRIEQMAGEMKRGQGGSDSFQDLASNVMEINNEVRRIMADLRPSVLDDLGIIAAMKWFCREYEKTYSHISVENQISISEHEVPDSLKTPIFRICQEAMNNIAKYSRATVVNLSLQKEGGIELVIRDNGQGFSLDTTKKGLGLSTMRERAELSGGSFDLESAMGKGTLIRVWWTI
jgi:PAS domain S-box-containing protein